MKRLTTGILIVLIAASSITRAGVTHLKAECRKGKTYVTFTQTPEGKLYRVYRSTEKIRAVADMKPVATLDDTSSREPHHGWQHIISDKGQPLDKKTGLFVYTPKKDEQAYYAVTVDDHENIAPGVNALAEPVAETQLEWPGAVLREIKKDRRGLVHVFYYWMDHADWNHAAEYYGHYFVVWVPETLKGKAGNPLITNLHSASGASTPGATGVELPRFRNAVSVATSDTYRRSPVKSYVGSTGWSGYTNNFKKHRPKQGDVVVGYTELRVVAYTHAVMADPRFGIDPNRVYLRGSSMGGMGTLFIGSHYPDLWASMRANVAPIFRGNSEPRDWGDVKKRWASPGEWLRGASLFGPRDLGLTLANGVRAYDWYSISWMARNRLDTDLPPLVHSHASKDWKRAMRLNRNLYRAFAETRRGVWGLWVDKGHGRHGHHAYGHAVVPGGFMRFLKNEMYPAFSNASKDDDYGQKDQDKRAFIGATGDKDPLKFDAAGVMNTYIDWTSKLHDMGLADDDLVDAKDRIAITMKSGRPDTMADVTPHRVQNFVIEPGKACPWKNVDVATGKLVASGEVTADKRGLITVRAFAISKTGNRLIVTLKK